MEQESQMILRVPMEIAELINKVIDEKGGDEFDLELMPKMVKNSNNETVTQFDFKYGDFQSTASILDLPCVIESHKTLDDISVYKCANISQMVFVHPNQEEFLEEVPNFQLLAKKQVNQETQVKNVKYLARDGLTAPTKDIRNRFFRKEFPIDKKEIREVEKEMVQILKEMKEKNEESKKNQSKLSDIDFNV